MQRIIKVIVLCFVCISIQQANAQTKSVVEKDTLSFPYDPEANAKEDLDKLITQAAKESKHIIIQAGGNWCIWCLRFNDYIHKTADIKQYLQNNYLYYHLNYSKENKNDDVFQKYVPDSLKLGYPFFIVLDSKGEVLKIQESGALEDGKSYSKDRVMEFFRTWAKK
ncbi:hypothetical protein SF1_38030 [Sphingobacterium faecium NBRC 15299]|jgi:thioredoxin-related protein|uniref:thioredoxin family protein n=1 Tax=Sphingobacterium faecium TaxID=34087 RepID=UPI000D35289A|nr:thioredoxin family protein [Sphingobacterium faecium]PTX13390.1 thioredoxin-like protein [Sphingobacterium faecium]GEM65821.1 hypothetical protein SF1_38030 [Sphingobacterium faecium NBRC 15299]